MKTIVILSGGLDSSILLATLLAQGRQVKCISIDYGQRHRRELQAATQIAAHYKVDRQTADLSGLKRFLEGSSQTDRRVEVPKGHYAEESMKATVVPNRNMLLLATAAAWAISLKYDTIAYGAHAGDHAIYPDCREEFVGPLNQALENADWHKVTIERPFLQWTKADIVAEGARIGVPMRLTYSCYEGLELQCGACGTCVERRMAFIEAGVDDPTSYATALKSGYVEEAQANNMKRAKRNLAHAQV